MYIPWHFVLLSASLWAGVGELLEEWVFRRAVEVLVSDRRREIWVGPAQRWTTSVLSHKSGDGDQLNGQCGEEEGGHVLRATEVTETSTYKNSSPCLPWQISKIFLLCSVICLSHIQYLWLDILFCTNFTLILSSARSDSVRGEEAVYSPSASKTHRPSEESYNGFTFWCTSPAINPHITSEDTS